MTIRKIVEGLAVLMFFTIAALLVREMLLNWRYQDAIESSELAALKQCRAMNGEASIVYTKDHTPVIQCKVPKRIAGAEK